MSSPKLNERCASSMSNGKKHLSQESKEDSLDNSIRESVKSERGSKCEEDWRKRTIIIEKKNGSYGFTLQSYGIHYKKEQEIDVITYVDHVEAGGPAATGGMREGDVILSINGRDVDRADHATLVDVIAAADARMRMVVLFEDCVRKVELHLRYIKLQRTLQSKLRELEQLNIRERHLFDNNWKTHSLPSQKKRSSPSGVEPDDEENATGGDTANSTYCRSTLSSENVTATRPPQPSVFMYQYLDPRYGSCVIQSNIRSSGFLITVGSPQNRRDCHQYVVKSTSECHRAVDAYKPSNEKHNKAHRNSHGCAPCMPVYNGQDANSLDAYDLASPCCDPHCVPNSRRKVRRKKECSKEHKRKDKGQQLDKSTSTQKSDTCTHSRTKKICPGHCPSRYRNLATESTQTSQCSLQSYSASNATGPCDNSASSYSTSLSTDTLFWDNDRSEAKASPKIQYHNSHQQHVKPKSWDNLTTRAIGGYGFGYGYMDTTAKQVNRSKSHGRNHGGRTHSHHEYQQNSSEKQSHRQNATPHHYSMYGRSDGHSHYVPTKSTESLIVVPKYQLEASGSEGRLTCDCGETIDYYRRVNTAKGPAEHRSSAYYTHHVVYSKHSHKNKESKVSSEITRL